MDKVIKICYNYRSDEFSSATTTLEAFMFKKYFRTLLVALSAILLAGCWDTGRGEKIGSITRLNRQGIFCQTWEAEIIRGGLNTGSGVMGQAFHFTIENDALAKEVEKYMNSQQEVKITYKRELNSFCRSDSADVFLEKIEPLNVVATPPAQVKVEPPRPAAASSSTEQQTIDLIKKQQEQLDRNQRLMQQLLDERSKK